MLYSKLFGKTKHQPPKDELTINAKLLDQAGYVNKVMAGVYNYLPLGLKVIRNIEQIVREEMNAIGGQEVFLPALHPSENWKKTSGWNNIDVLFKLKSRTKRYYALGQSHEEIITPLFKQYINSYKDLPLALYQIQQKFRDELRAKSGILRGREFTMKDMYSWHYNQQDFDRFYKTVKQAYLKIFKRCGLTTKVTQASGGSFTQKISYEFMVLTNAGEDDILYCNKCEYCINIEIAQLKEKDKCPQCRKDQLTKSKASEIGNVFDLGTKYCQDFQLQLIDEKGKKFYPIMGCYGIGINRLMGVIVETHYDKQGIIWPRSVSPYQTHLIGLNLNQKKIKQKLNKIYQNFQKNNIKTLYDDREDVSAGEKFADSDLIGIPIRLVVSKKTGDKIEYKKRDNQKTKLLNFEQIIKTINNL